MYESEEVHCGRTYHDLILVGTDWRGQPRQAHSKGITPGSTFRYDIEGSDKNYGFHHIGTSDKLYVFEAAVDLISYLTLHPADWQRHSYLALGGAAECAMLQTLQDYPRLRQIALCLDHDPGGQLGAVRLTNILFAKGYNCTWKFPREAKDWNEELKRQNGKPYQAVSEDKPLTEIMLRGIELFPIARQKQQQNIPPERIEVALWQYKNAKQLTDQVDSLYKASLCAAVQAVCFLRQTGQELPQEAFLAGLCAAVRPNIAPPTLDELQQAAASLCPNTKGKIESPRTEQEIRTEVQQYLYFAGQCLLLAQNLEQTIVQTQKIRQKEANEQNGEVEVCQMNLC